LIVIILEIRVIFKQTWEKRKIQVGRRRFLIVSKKGGKPYLSDGKEWQAIM
jgi:hypothetical protein